MLAALAAAVQKDLRLLVRDRAGLVFLMVGPVVVITVAGLSLASLYGAPTGRSHAYVLPLADEDGGRVGAALARRLRAESVVEVRPVADGNAARALVRRHEVGAALVVPAGTSAAIADGGSAPLVLLTDPVRNFEVATVRAVVQELRHALERAAHARAKARLEKALAHAAAARARFTRALERLRARLERLPVRRADAERRLAAARARAERELRATLEAAVAAREAAARARLTAVLTPLRSFVAELGERQAELDAWLAAVRAKAGRLADRMPAPPTPPALPPAVADLARADLETSIATLLPRGDRPTLPSLPRLDLPEPPSLPALTLPPPPELPTATLPGLLTIEETSVTGAPRRLNTFDQNVPGFSVTFLLLGMLLGVSLALLDERDWGTLERLRAMPTPLAATLIAKLAARFLVGMAQMLILFAVGWLAFGISLGPEPWALLLPTVGIVFAGTAFGLVVAGIAHSREAVLPVGSIVVVTMAAIGGCWWPIDLEPRWMREAAVAFPTTWAMTAFNDLMIRRQTIAAALRPTLVLLGYGGLYLLIGLALFRRHATRSG